MNCRKVRAKYRTAERRVPIPAFEEKPIQGLKSDKNFVTSNIVENVTLAPRKLKTEVDWTKKKNFGQVPRYLEKAKDRIQQEYEYLRQVHQDEEFARGQSKYQMSKEEIDELKDALRKKWEHVNKDYQSITHIGSQTGLGMKRKKEKCEKELAQIERDLDKLNKQYIFVDMTR